MSQSSVVSVVLASLVTWIATMPVQATNRVIVPLDGQWEITEGKLDTRPDHFDRRIPVPSLCDMATPPFEDIGVKSPQRGAFWYRRTFQIGGEIPPVAILNVRKAAYGAQVWLNEQLVGEHAGAFTPGYFDLARAIRGNGAANELLIRVGATPDALPKNRATGADFEKTLYQPGLYDSVEIVLSGWPHITAVQIVPEINRRSARIVGRVQRGPEPAAAKVTFRIREAASGKLVGTQEAQIDWTATAPAWSFDVRIPIEDCRLWSPEGPFLYALEVETASDTWRGRFGMRSFRFDPETGRAILNGRPYFLRGTNVCIFRFFEDADRGDKPWQDAWVRKLHRAFRDMHWNAARYCIGFPPERWYEIADELGVLIQDEFPIWSVPEGVTAEGLKKEYREWMEAHWNHPCVVIWDAQNETVTDETGKAIQAVRRLDLSDRPWDNGWSPPQAPGDAYEAHPYLFNNPLARLGDRAGDHSTVLNNPAPNRNNNAIIINEYGWLWLNRDGTPTTLTEKVYTTLLGADASPGQRRLTYARHLAALTEFFRAERRYAGVLHFCGLSYSRPKGQTCDNFVDLESLTFEPSFLRHVRDAFAPVGIMVDEWADVLVAGQPREIPVVVVNDLDRPCTATVRLTLSSGERVFDDATQPCEVPPLGRTRLVFPITIPEAPGSYQLTGELRGGNREPVRSLRDVTVLTAEQKRDRDGIATDKPTSASSVVTVGGESFPARHATDGRTQTRWSSDFSDPQWIAVDLTETATISRVELLWETAYPKSYAVEVSEDGQTWTPVFKTDAGNGSKEVIRFAPIRARWVKVNCIKRATQFGNSLWELRVFP